jgi:hypothetical protein
MNEEWGMKDEGGGKKPKEWQKKRVEGNNYYNPG